MPKKNTVIIQPPQTITLPLKNVGSILSPGRIAIIVALRDNGPYASLHRLGVDLDAMDKGLLSRNLDVLEAAGIVATQKVGRELHIRLSGWPIYVTE